MIRKHAFALSLIAVLIPLLAAGCKTTYYSFWEKMGKQKRDLLKDNVEAAREEQGEASEQFKDALTRIKELTKFEGGDLEKIYNDLSEQHKRCAQKASGVSERIAKMDDVAEDLFDEWKGEIKEISSRNLREQSETKLKETRKKYESLRDAMVRAEKRMAPVLTQLQDQVLYLKHNLNAQAIGSLKGETQEIAQEIEKLIQEMNASIAEADSFIKTLQ